MINLYESYYFQFRSDLVIERLSKSRVKFVPLFFLPFRYPWMLLLSVIAVISARKDSVQRGYNWEILRYLFSSAVSLFDNIAVNARKVDGRSCPK